jgi:hypothetical protein
MTEVTIRICFDRVEISSGIVGSILVISSKLVFWPSRYATNSLCAFDICWLQNLHYTRFLERDEIPTNWQWSNRNETFVLILGDDVLFPRSLSYPMAILTYPKQT